MFRGTTAILLVALSVIFLGLLSSVQAAPTPVEDVQALGRTFQELRKIKGHFDGGEYNPDVDGYNGEKHQVMQVHKSNKKAFSIVFCLDCLEIFIEPLLNNSITHSLYNIYMQR
jgi:hypothetical protein